LRYKQAMNPLETYLKEMRDIRSTGAAVAETSFYPVLSNLLNEVGQGLKPKVRCVINIANRGAGLPDGGLFTPDQFQKATDAAPKQGQLPSRGVLEAKGPADEVPKIARSLQVKRYSAAYGLVLVTNYRDFLLLGHDAQGNSLPMEGFTLADTESAFWQLAAHPQKAAAEHGERFCEYLKRVMLSVAPLSAPQDVAWFLASYARDAKARVENHKDLSALAAVRDALEEALGMKFTGEKGEHFFRSTLVQTIFYGVFSAWVLWHRENPSRADTFDWQKSAWSLRVPFISALYNQVATPSQLGPLGLVEVLDWTAGALSRVNRAAFFQKFQDEHAVQYFYEPFLEAFDPQLRKDLGVWYTPPEIVQYQVARVDAVLRDPAGLNIPDGLADPNVVVLDPCCGTGAYLVEVLKKIAETLKAKGGDALIASDLKKAATTRVFGFEILPSPFVVSHLQLGLMLHDLGAPLSTAKNERVGVYLTNSLTGWEPPKNPKTLLFPELQAERDAADSVKRDKQILVVLGNPPYNGFAGLAVDEERELSNAYRTTKRAPKPQGQGLNDLFVRFFRMAERRIVEKSGMGVVCFISNYAWLEGLSFTGMRERYLEAFDRIAIDCLNGDKYKTGKLTPDGQSDPSVFSTEFNREGIQVGTAISLLVRRERHKEANAVLFRNFWGKNKRAELLDSLQTAQPPYEKLLPPVEIGLPFKPAEVTADYLTWPLLPELLPASFPGVKTSRDELVVDIDGDRLIDRIKKYFDPKVSHEEMRAISPAAVTDASRFEAISTREYLRKRGFLSDNVVRYCYRPFDVRWIYWEPERKLLDEKRAEYFPHVFPGNVSMSAVQQNRKGFNPPFPSKILCALHLIERGANIFPMLLNPSAKQHLFNIGASKAPVPNLSELAAEYLKGLGYGDLTQGAGALFHGILALLHSPAYAEQNEGALRQDWPRVPLPASLAGLEASAELGRQVAALLDTQSSVRGVIASPIEPIFRTIGVLAKVGGGAVNPDSDCGDLAVEAGWGHAGKEGVTMPAKGRIVQRPFDQAELGAIAQAAAARGLSAKQALAILGEDTRDVYLNDKAYWRNVPAGVWEYFIGGYQVIKKWLSYRELELLGRPLTADEAREVMNIARRLSAIVLMQPALDENYRRTAKAAYPWRQ
jgi:type I restriction-modification system DNA methylase subunit